MYLLSFWTLSIERFWFLFWSILNDVTLKTSNMHRNNAKFEWNSSSIYHMTWNTLEKQNIQTKGPNVWLLRGVWLTSEKKYSADWFQGEKILARKYLVKKKFLHWKNISFMEYNAGKKSYSFVCQEKNSISSGLEKTSYPNQITHTPPQKVKWSAPK